MPDIRFVAVQVCGAFTAACSALVLCNECGSKPIKKNFTSVLCLCYFVLLGEVAGAVSMALLSCVAFAKSERNIRRLICLISTQICVALWFSVWHWGEWQYWLLLSPALYVYGQWQKNIWVRWKTMLVSSAGIAGYYLTVGATIMAAWEITQVIVLILVMYRFAEERSGSFDN